MEPARATHCKHGHEWTAANTHYSPKHGRVCRKCREDATQRWRANNPAAHMELERLRGMRRRRDPNKREAVLRNDRRANRKYRYEVTDARYAEMFAAQDGNCAICGTNQRDLPRKLCIDHNHSTGAVRALLCNGCNSGIGYMKENIEFLKNAIAYLAKHGSV